MIATINHLKDQSNIIPVCIGVHAVFADHAYEELKATGVEEIVTCNTVPHETNRIDVSGFIIKALRGFDINHKNG